MQPATNAPQPGGQQRPWRAAMTTPGTPDGAQKAYREAVSMEVPALVQALSDLIGLRLVAQIGAVKETRAVRQWIAHERSPSAPTVKRLRDTYQIARSLTESCSPEVIQAWFDAMNPLLGDSSPARLLRDSERDDTAVRVLTAARSFASGSG
ncbi:hypothetical protein QK292_03825 [Arthrobacter sp. AL08]|uniref:hypothetical protein n=2 Tax=unclassified Arthrobacter TaxID=235627 RepID=UPI002096E813|nr:MULTISPECIES: hypothetical protein [unclassified Arthrobacter]MDD1478204.1 hypothetical protein [Arthrobacter sp. H16F315]MDI3240692.1 hypothetical protein [Arthrobacter sp. AL05]MDI3276702.1 hypothetical protein [Arthrobacter sp. AL08]